MDELGNASGEEAMVMIVMVAQSKWNGFSNGLCFPPYFPFCLSLSAECWDCVADGRMVKVGKLIGECLSTSPILFG